jgi:hypothetical protein
VHTRSILQKFHIASTKVADRIGSETAQLPAEEALMALCVAHEKEIPMKATLRSLVLAGIFALIAAGTAMPAHAAIGGSNPRPTSSTGN